MLMEAINGRCNDGHNVYDDTDDCTGDDDMILRDLTVMVSIVCVFQLFESSPIQLVVDYIPKRVDYKGCLI